MKIKMVILILSFIFCSCLFSMGDNEDTKIIKKIERLTTEGIYFKTLWDKEGRIYSFQYEPGKNSESIIYIDYKSKEKHKVKDVESSEDELFLYRKKLEKNLIDKYKSKVTRDIDYFMVSEVDKKIIYKECYRLEKWGELFSDIWIIDLESGKKEKLISNKDPNVKGGFLEPIEWSPKGRYFTFKTTGDHYYEVHYYLYDLKKKKIIGLELPDPKKIEYGWPSWSPDGTKISFGAASDNYYGHDFAYCDIYIAHLDIEY